jgi:hypothetical protein
MQRPVGNLEPMEREETEREEIKKQTKINLMYIQMYIFILFYCVYKTVAQLCTMVLAVLKFTILLLNSKITLLSRSSSK